MVYFFLKSWSIGIIGFILFISIAIKPEFITKYGYTNDTINNVVRYISVFLVLIWLFPHRELAIDTIGYIKTHDNYIMETKCQITETQNSVWFFFAQKSILCKNNDRLIDIFTGRFYHKGDSLLIRYLPKSKLIIEVKNLE